MRIERFNCALLSILVIASIVTLAIQLLSSSPVHAALTSHAPIYIDSNAGFTAPDPVNGGGSGTENDPYIIENWDISAENANGIEITNTAAYFIVRNCAVRNGEVFYSGIYLDNVTNGKIETCTSSSNGDSGIYLYNSPKNILTKNTCFSNTTGIHLSYSSNNTVTSNKCYNVHYGSSANGFWLNFYSDNNDLDNNECLYNTSGIGITLCSSNILLNNNCSNGRWGIILDQSSNNILTNNTCHNNFEDGILLYSSSNNILTNNGVSDSGYGVLAPDGVGILLQGSNNNRIYHNNIVNNAAQASDNGTNYWDNGYPSGGNYWSDFTRTDNYGGENQDMLGSDGIWDSPYYISGGTNLDRYPLRMLGLLAGWNLVGFTSLGDNNTPANIFTGLAYYTDYYLYYWNAPSGPYTMQDPDQLLKDNTGYWVWIDRDNMATTTNYLPPTCDASLVAGWNLISFPIVNDNTTPNHMFAGLTYLTNYTIYSWDAPGGPYELQDENQLPTGNLGYWIWIDQDMTVTVP